MVRGGEALAVAIKEARRKQRENDIKDDPVGEFADKFRVPDDAPTEGVLPQAKSDDGSDNST